MSERNRERRRTRERSGSLVGDDSDPRSLEPTRAPAHEPARNLELERSIIERWDDDGAWAVYADWLLAQGDPHGELLGLELAIEASGNRAQRGRLEHARRQLCERHVQTFGEWFVAGEKRIEVELGVELQMRRGFIEQARFSGARSRPKRPKRMSLQQAIETFVTCSAARFLRELRLARVHWPTAFRALAALEPRSSLRVVSLHDDSGVVELEPALVVAPELSALDAFVHDLVIAPRWVCPGLATLTLRNHRADSLLLERLASASLAGLHGLQLTIGVQDDLALSGFERLWTSPGLPALAQLRLYVARAELVELLAGSPLLAQLRVLELQFFHGSPRASWLEPVLANAEHLARVERLELALPPLSPPEREELSRVLPNASLVGVPF